MLGTGRGPNVYVVGLRLFIVAVTAAAAAFVTVVPVVRAQECDTVSSRTSLSAFSGARIRSLQILTQSPPGFPGIARALDNFHVRTREGTVQRQIRFAAGDTVDTLAVGESIRRLRRDRYLRDVELRGVRCGDQPVDLVLVTRDDWSVKPKLQVRSSGNSEVGVTERNLFGSGRELSLHVRSQQGRIGIGVTFNDPWFLGSRVGASLGENTYREGQEWTALFRLREPTILAPWGAELGAIQSTYAAPGVSSDRFDRASAHLLVRRRLFAGSSAVGSVLAGAEGERAALRAAPDAPIVGPSRVTRSFTGVSVGAARAAVAYDTLTWMLPNDAIVDVPLAFEGEAVVGVGRDAAAAAPTVHFDVWSGKAWLPSRRSLVVADLWASAYAWSGRWDAATFRGALAYYHAASRGFWSARFTGERLLDPDPDVRSFVTVDPTAQLLPDRRRLAEAAFGLSVEREVRLRPLTRSWALDGAAFAAASSRWEAVAPSPEHLDAGILGLGLRLAPARAGRATARLDVGFPVLGSPLLRRGPYVAIGISPWWGDERHRAGRRE